MSITETVTVPLDRLHPNPDNPRKEAGDVTELANSIRQHGIKHRIIVRPAPEFGEGHYMIMDGYRRWVAAQIVLTSVTVDVENPHPDENLAISEILMALVTSLHTEKLGPMEKARAYQRLMKEGGMTQKQVADTMGFKSDSSVNQYLSLLELSPGYQKAVETGRVSVARAMEAVKRTRAIQRKTKGQKPHGTEWEPDHFTPNHSLAKKARAMCDAREHTGRRRIGHVACGQCWETVIRQDEALSVKTEYKGMGFDVPFIPPIMTPGTVRETTNHRSE
jgi:ParB family transcriptional regulator, chromosome partitioning protein